MGQINDDKYAWLLAKGVPPEQINDMWMEYLTRPAILDSALIWLDETSHIISGSDITGWTNKGTGGSAYDLISATTGTQLPQLGTYNGVNVVQANAAPQGISYMQPASTRNISQPYTAFVTVKGDNAAAASQVIFDADGGGSRNQLYMRGPQADYVAQAGLFLTTSGAGGPITDPKVLMVFFNGASSRLIATDLVDVSGDTGTNNTLGYISLFTDTFVSIAFEGWIAEVIIIPGSLSESDITNVRNYLKIKMGIPA